MTATQVLIEMVAIERLKRDRAAASHRAAISLADADYAEADKLSTEVFRRQAAAWKAAHEVIAAGTQPAAPSEKEALTQAADNAERRAIMFGDILHQHGIAMQAAVVERYAGRGAEAAMDWIVNTLRGPGFMPDMDAAVALPSAKKVGPAQAWFDTEMAKQEAFRASHPGPAAAPAGAVAAAVIADRAARAAPAVPEALLSIAELLHTQDNRITADPLFAVQQKRRIYGLDSDYSDACEWIVDGEEWHPDHGEEPPENARRVGYVDKWEFVTGCFTEQGCKDYIRANGHNLHEPRIYAYGSFRNEEFIAVRNWLMSLVAAPKASDAVNNPGATVKVLAAATKGRAK